MMFSCGLYRQLRLLLWREAQVYRGRWGMLLFIYGFCWPTVLIGAKAYLGPLMFFGKASSQQGTLLFLGSLLLYMMMFAFNGVFNFIHERATIRLIEYHRVGSSLFLVLLSRVLFGTGFLFVFVLPLIPLAKIVLPQHFYADRIAWGFLLISLLLSSLLIVSYGYFVSSFYKGMKSADTMWMRINEPLLLLGGPWSPWFIMDAISPSLSFLSRVNPLLYVTESLRQSVFRDGRFFSLTYCYSMMSLFAILFIAGGYYVLRKNLDSV